MPNNSIPLITFSLPRRRGYSKRAGRGRVLGGTQFEAVRCKILAVSCRCVYSPGDMTVKRPDPCTCKTCPYANFVGEPCCRNEQPKVFLAQGPNGNPMFISAWPP